MGKTSFIPDSISSARIVSHGKIESLANGFSLPNKEGFTIYARPKEGVTIDTPDIVLSVKCMTDDNPSEVPVLLNKWNSLYLESIAPNNEILNSIDLYWGAGFYIVKGKGKYYTEPTAVSTRYSGEAQALVTAGSGTGVVKYRLADGEWSENIPTATNVGVYEVEYKMEGNNLYEPIEAKKLRCSIAEKFVNDPTIELTPSSFTYNGSACVPTVVVKDGQRVIPTEEYTVEITNNINAGTANVVIRDNIAGNYEVIGQTTFEIAKASRTLSFATIPTSLDVDESSVVAATPSAGANDGTITYSSSDTTKISVDGNVITGVANGNATITAAISEGANYLGASITSSSITVAMVDYSIKYLTLVPIEDSTFSFTKSGLSYSLDEGSTWTALEANGTTPTVTAGSKILFKNNTTLTPSSDDGIGTFSSSKSFDVQGNIMSLYFGDNFANQTSLSGKNYAFMYLFNNSKVRNAKCLILPATTLAKGCYFAIFNMCQSLTTAPKALPATTLANHCYNQMFNGCGSLTTAPELSATRLADRCCYRMFYDCRALTTAPELSATTLVQACYLEMFCWCPSLNYVKILATDISATDCLYHWLRYVSESGTFVKAEGVTIPSGESGIPNGWTVQEV